MCQSSQVEIKNKNGHNNKNKIQFTQEEELKNNKNTHEVFNKIEKTPLESTFKIDDNSQEATKCSIKCAQNNKENGIKDFNFKEKLKTLDMQNKVNLSSPLHLERLSLSKGISKLKTVEDNSTSTLKTVEDKSTALKTGAINTSSNNNSFNLPIQLDGEIKHVLFDTGASISCIKFDKSFDNRIKPSSIQSLKLADNDKNLTVIGEIQLLIKINDIETYHTFLCTPKLSVPILIGADFLNKNKLDLIYNYPTYEIKKNCDSINRIKKPELESSRTYALYSNENITIYPEQTITTTVNVYCDEVDDKKYLKIYPNFANNSQKENLTVITKNAKFEPFIEIQIHNNFDKPISIGKATKIATAYETLHENSNSKILFAKAENKNYSIENQIQNLTLENSELTDSERNEVKNLLLEFSDIFAKSQNDVGMYQDYEYKIQLKDSNQVINESYRQIPIHKREITKCLVNDLLQSDIIEPCQSSYNNPVVLISKKSLQNIDKNSLPEELAKHYRLCLDLRKLNKNIEIPISTLPNIEEILQCMSKNKFYSQLDIQQAFHNILLEESSRKLTSFCVLEKQYCYKRLMFGLASAPTIFNNVMQNILSELLYTQVVLFFDDLSIIDDSLFSSHLSNLRCVFQKLRKANLKIRLDKCNFFAPEIKYLGFTIDKRGQRMDTDQISCIARLPQPKNVQQLQQALGIFNYFRKFVPDFAGKAKPLFNLLRKNSPFIFSPECEESFQLLKTALITPPILKIPIISSDNTAPLMILDCDASQEKIGSVLLQLDENGKEHVISYFSKCLTKSQIKLCTYRQELLAIIESLHKFKNFLLPKKFLIRCDHKPLESILSCKNPNAYLARQLEFLGQFQFEISHRPGKKHRTADFVSRIPFCSDLKCKLCSNTQENDYKNPQNNRNDHIISAVHVNDLSFPSLEKIAEEQLKDEEISLMIEILVNDLDFDETNKELTPETKLLLRIRPTLKVQEGVLFKERITETDQTILVPVLPASLVNQVVTKTHYDISSGSHFGYTHIIKRLQNEYFWPNLSKDVRYITSMCIICQKQSRIFKKHRADLQPIKTTAPFQKIHIDACGPFPPTRKEGYKYLICIIDHFTKFALAFPTDSLTAEKTANILLNNWISYFSYPIEINSDNGPNFSAKLMKELCILLNIRKLTSTPYHPESNGIVESYVKRIKHVIHRYAHEDKFSWHEKINSALLTLNTSYNSTIKMSPYQAIFGVLPNKIDTPYLENVFAEFDETTDFVKKHQDHLIRVHEIVKQNTEESAQIMKSRYDRHEILKPLKVNDKVFVLNTNTGNERTKNFNKWIGPFVIVEKYSDLTYRINPLRYPQDRRKSKIKHRNQIKLAKLDVNNEIIDPNQSELIRNFVENQFDNNEELIENEFEDYISEPEITDVPDIGSEIQI